MDLMLMMAIGIVAMLAGFVGCFLPVLPGPAIAYAALFVLFAFGCPLTTMQLIVGAGVLIVVTLVDYILPSVCAGGSLSSRHCRGRFALRLRWKSRVEGA